MLAVGQPRRDPQNHEDEEEPLIIIALNADKSVSWKQIEAKVSIEAHVSTRVVLTVMIL